MLMYDYASLEARISSLEGNALTILSKVAEGLSDSEITRWSGGWNFTQNVIEDSLQKIYRALEIGAQVPQNEQRRRAAEYYNRFVAAPYPTTAMSRAQQDKIKYAASASDYIQTAQEGETMDFHSDPRIENFCRLTVTQLKIASTLSRGERETQLVDLLHVSCEEAETLIVEVCDIILEDSAVGTALERQAVVGQFYLSYIAKGSRRSVLSLNTNVALIEATAPKFSQLSRNQILVIEGMVANLDNEALAKKLGILPSSVPQYFVAIYKKLNLTKELGNKERRRICTEAYKLYIPPPLQAELELAPTPAVEVAEPQPQLNAAIKTPEVPPEKPSLPEPIAY